MKLENPETHTRAVQIERIVLNFYFISLTVCEKVEKQGKHEKRRLKRTIKVRAIVAYHFSFCLRIILYAHLDSCSECLVARVKLRRCAVKASSSN